MDRYFKILGIPANSSKEEIKKAYHVKMKALHPDKVHGTSLEDTATFFSAEINEAYNVLMTQYSDKKTTSSNETNQNNQSGFEVENIFIEGSGLLKYTISNNINIIISEIVYQTKNIFPDKVDEIPWTLNTMLSENVKFSMNKHNMNYSMTTYMEGSIRYIVINKRAGKNWYYSCYEINSGYKSEQKPSYNYNTENYTNYSRQNSSYPENNSSFWFFLKIMAVIVIIILVFQQFSNPQSKFNQSRVRTQNSGAVQVFAIVTSCDWLNVRSSPSSVNNNNVIEAIRVNTRVEILNKENNGWTRIRYSNGKIGYVHGSFLSLQ